MSTDSTDFAAFKAAAAAAATTEKVEEKGTGKPETEEAEQVENTEETTEEAGAGVGTEDTGEGEESGEDEGDKKTSKKRAVSERINKYRAQRDAAEARAAEEAQRLAQQNELLDKMKAKLAKAGINLDDDDTTTDSPEDDKAPKPPSVKDFKYGKFDPAYDEAQAAYARDLAKYETLKVLKEAEQERLAAEEEQENARTIQEVKTKYESLVERGIDKYEDFEDIVLKGAEEESWRLSPEAALMLTDSSSGEDVLYYLATNPAEAERIASLPVVLQAREIGKLESRFANTDGAQSETKPAKKPVVSGAPGPIKAARSSSGTFVAKADTTDFAAYKRMLAQHQKR